MENNQVVLSREIKGARVTNIIFSVLSIAAFIAAIFFFVVAIDAHLMQGDGSNNSLGAGLGFALGFLFYLICGTVACALAIVSCGVASVGHKERRKESAIFLAINLTIIIAYVAFLATILIINATR